jgi:hypothetical protein
METVKFAALVPHRDCRAAVEKYRRTLFAKGFTGAFAFPAVAPLAFLGRPLDPAELKNAALNLRENLGEKKICCSGYSGYSTGNGSSAGLRFFGVTLDMPLLAFPTGAVLRQWENPILAPALVFPEDGPEQLPVTGMPEPEISFRAAALANLAFTWMGNPLGITGSHSFTWDLGPLFWLPRYSGKKP